MYLILLKSKISIGWSYQPRMIDLKELNKWALKVTLLRKNKKNMIILNIKATLILMMRVINNILIKKDKNSKFILIDFKVKLSILLLNMLKIHKHSREDSQYLVKLLTTVLLLQGSNSLVRQPNTQILVMLLKIRT